MRSTHTSPSGCETLSRGATLQTESLTSEASQMSSQTISEDSPSATSLRGSESGLMLSGRQDGRTIDQSGLVPAPVNLSARQAREQGFLTSGICGPTSSTSSKSVGLQQYLVSRLQARTDSLGSTLYKLTWRLRALPSGRLIFALRASVPRTSGSGCTGWVTPTTRDWKDTPGMATAVAGRTRLDQLPRQAAQWVGFGQMLTGSTSGTRRNALFNPALSRWLIGLPATWDDAAPMEMPS